MVGIAGFLCDVPLSLMTPSLLYGGFTRIMLFIDSARCIVVSWVPSLVGYILTNSLVPSVSGICLPLLASAFGALVGRSGFIHDILDICVYILFLYLLG